MMIIRMNIRLHKLLKYLIVIVFIGDLIISVVVVIHIAIKIIIDVLILLWFDHFCLEFGRREIT